MGTGVLATNPQFCAAINRHVLADPADWRKADAFYKSEPCNWYAKFFHQHSLGKKPTAFATTTWLSKRRSSPGRARKSS